MVSKTNRLIVCVDIILVYFESLMKHKLLCGKNFFSVETGGPTISAVN